MKHLILFDIDGTLVNAGGAGQQAMEAALAELFQATRPVEGISTAGRTDRAITEDLFRYYEITHDAANVERFLEAYLAHLPAYLSDGDGLVLPGVLELLESLAVRSDVVVSLLTGNYRRGAELKLDHFGLRRHFVAGGFGDVHHDRDDVARVALQSIEKHIGEEIGTHRIWVIGDTPSDVKCGRAIGAEVIAVATGLFSVEQLRVTEPDHLFASFADVPAVLRLFGS